MELDHLLATDGIRMRRGPIFDTDPPPKPDDFDFGRVEGMLLGVAVGDSLGAPTESMLPGPRRAKFGEIRDYLPNRYVDDGRGYPTDDTQLTFRALEAMIADGRFDPDHVARRFCEDRIFGIGSTVREFVRRYKRGTPLRDCAPNSAGNGALMRIAPALIPHLRTGGRRLWADAAILGRLTHDDSCSNAACVAFVAMLWDLLDMDAAPEPTWWLRRYVEIARELETGEEYRPRGGAKLLTFRGSAWRFVEESVGEAWGAGMSVVDACQSWYSGAYLLETIPSVLYILMKHAGDPEEAIVRAVNDTRDNDTVAAIVGAAVGALHGRSGLPGRWVERLSGRLGEEDDGRVFDVIEATGQRFWVEQL